MSGTKFSSIHFLNFVVPRTKISASAGTAVFPPKQAVKSRVMIDF